jgi:hypothetical protein
VKRGTKAKAKFSLQLLMAENTKLKKKIGEGEAE